MRPGPSDINCLQGIYAGGGAGMGIKPLAGGEGGGYVVNVQVLGPTTALGWVGVQKLKYRPFPIKIHVFFIGNGRFCLCLSVSVYAVPAPACVLAVLVCQVWDLLRLAKNADTIKTRPIVPRILAPTAVQEKCTPIASAPKIAAAASMIREAIRVDTRGRFSSAGSLLLWPRQTASSLVD